MYISALELLEKNILKGYQNLCNSLLRINPNKLSGEKKKGKIEICHKQKPPPRKKSILKVYIL